MSAARSPLILTLWLAVCSWASISGWALSALGWLNPTGWAISTLALVPVGMWLARQSPWKMPPRRRWRRALPGAWAVLFALAMLGALLHPPSHYDALAYRVPRVLHWLAEEQWHWIHTHFFRMNTRATGYEWLMAPWIALGGTDRWTWLPNAAAYWFMPGLIFSVFTRLGLGARAAWRWMWVLPGAYGFILQAGGLGNDMIGAVFALAAMHFALRTRDHGSWPDLAGTLIASGLMTGMKASNLTLLLPVALALLPRWRLPFARPFSTLAAGLVAAAVSLLPIAVLNWWHCGDWTGARYEMGTPLTGTPLVEIAGNVVVLTVQNITPPILPGAPRWSEYVTHIFPESLRAEAFLAFQTNPAILGELQDEGNCLGFGVALLIAWSAMGGLRGGLLRWSPWVSLLVYISLTGVGITARLILPYYLLLIPALIAGDKAQRLVRSRAWHGAALFSLALAALAVVLTPSRPLWPARTISGWLAAHYPGSPVIERIHTVYSVYAERPYVLMPILAALPANERVFGLVTSDEPETPIWRPFGTRRFRHVNAEDTAADLRARGVRTIVVSSNGFSFWMKRPFEQWLRDLDAERVATFPLKIRAGQPAWDWHVVRLREAAVGKRAPMP